MIKNNFPPEMLPVRELQLIKALTACTGAAGAYYDFNVTKDIIIGTPIQVLDGVEYNILEYIGLSENCPYTRVVEYWGKRIKDDARKGFFEFFSIKHLMDCYRRGDKHIMYTYWTKDVLGSPMLAEQNILLYEDVTNGDLLGLTYIKDLKSINALLYKTQHDDLTDLLNRGAFDVFVAEMFESKMMSNSALLLIDLDYFKNINDTRGHIQGDNVLKFVAKLLRENFRKTDHVARVGGDEFAVYFENLQEEHAYRVVQTIDNINDLLRENEFGFSCSVSAGLAFYEKGDGYIDLYQRADKVLYQKKEQGRCGCVVANKG